MGRVSRERQVCEACDALVPRTGTVLCLSCLRGDPAESPAPTGGCGAHGSGRLVIAGPAYEPPVDRIVRGFKYEGARRLAPWIAALLPEPPDPYGVLVRESILVPVPLHPARRARRGFDQASLLAEAASRRWGIPLVPSLERVRDDKPQARLDPARRRENVRGAFRALPGNLARGRPVILVDDVVTTGSTLLEARDALEEAAPAWVLAICAAHGGPADLSIPGGRTGPETPVQRSVAAPGIVW